MKNWNTFNAESNEIRQSAFIAWWLNPKSEHGLGDMPLKLFLRLVAKKSWGKSTFGVDGFDGAFYTRVLAGNYNVELLEDIEIEKDYIDIWTVLELSYEEDFESDRRIIPVVIENKITGNDGANLTERYLNAVVSYPRVENVEQSSMGILLTEEPAEPSCNQFDNITYQELWTDAIEPLVLDKHFKFSNEDDRKYIVSHKGKAVFPDKLLSRSMAACAIFKAYLEEYPATTLEELQKAFPCEGHNEFFYESNPENIDESGYQVLPRIGGDEVGSLVEARCDFFVGDDQLLPIENGTKKAMCVKVWHMSDFDRLIHQVFAKGYDKFITVDSL